MGDVLAIMEQRDGSVRNVSREVVCAAAEAAEAAGGAADALLLGGAGIASEAGGMGRWGARAVKVAESDALADYNGEAWARVVADVARDGGYGLVVFPATTLGKDLAPRVAALLDVPLAADVTEIDASGGQVVVTRPVYAGKAFARLRLEGSPALVSIRPNVFAPEVREGAGEVSTFTPDVPDGAARIRVTGFEGTSGDAVDVAEASIVVSGGRGMKDPENWELLEDLRSALGNGAALGASRAVVDAGWRPHGEQVGQTGKTVAPKLYFAVGISGAIQHLAGMRSSGTIVAVNKDPDAPIFNVADYGVVGDLFEVVPRLAEEIRKVRG